MRAFRRARTDQQRELAIRRRQRREGEAVELPEEWLHEPDGEILAFLIDEYNPQNGRVFPSNETIAAAIGRAESFVNAAKARLKRFGFLNWVRRTKVKPAAEGKPGPRLEQTSCAYLFDWADRLTGKARETFLRVLAAGLKRVRFADGPGPRQEIKDDALRRALEELSAGIADEQPSNASP